MVVNFIVQQSCLVTQVDGAEAPAVNCLHGEPFLVSTTDTPPARLMSTAQYDSRRAPKALWTVTF